MKKALKSFLLSIALMLAGATAIAVASVDPEAKATEEQTVLVRVIFAAEGVQLSGCPEGTTGYLVVEQLGAEIHRILCGEFPGVEIGAVAPLKLKK